MDTAETLADVMTAGATTEILKDQAIKLVEKTSRTRQFIPVAPPVMAVLERLINETLRAEMFDGVIADLLKDEEIWRAVNAAPNRRRASALLDILRKRTRERLATEPTPDDDEPMPDIDELALRLLDELVECGRATQLEKPVFSRVLVAIEGMIAEAERGENYVAQILGEHPEVAEAVVAAARGGKAIALINALKHRAWVQRQERRAQKRIERIRTNIGHTLGAHQPRNKGPRIGRTGKTAQRNAALAARGKTPEQVRREHVERDRAIRLTMQGMGSGGKKSNKGKK